MCYQHRGLTFKYVGI